MTARDWPEWVAWVPLVLTLALGVRETVRMCREAREQKQRQRDSDADFRRRMGLGEPPPDKRRGGP